MGGKPRRNAELDLRVARAFANTAANNIEEAIQTLTRLKPEWAVDLRTRLCALHVQLMNEIEFIEKRRERAERSGATRAQRRAAARRGRPLAGAIDDAPGRPGRVS